MKLKTNIVTNYLILFIVINLSTLVKDNHLNKKIASKKNEFKNENFQEFQILWKTLFNGSREENCKQSNLKLTKIQVQGEIQQTEKKIAWKKKWGNGPVAYFFDYLDNVLLEDVIQDFTSIYKNLKDLPKHKDEDEKFKESEQLKKNKNIIKKFNQDVYNNAITLNQLKIGFSQWKWNRNPGFLNTEENFIKQYDRDLDGRLNPRELIVGAIDVNKNILGKGICQNCFENSGKKIDAIFTFIDCNNQDSIGAEEIFIKLGNLKRPSDECNIFNSGMNGRYRTIAINDFILKNNEQISGKLSRDEFRAGILYGFWDRQTNKFKIHLNDKLNLKKKRWSNDYMIDIKSKLIERFEHRK